jgi:nicotinamidase/pyrazinamidase
VKIEEPILMKKVILTELDALVVVDMQNDFMPSGALAVNDGDKIISPINRLAQRFHSTRHVIVMTQDWHPEGHLSFASSHNLKPYDPYESTGIGPILWPDHCVQGTEGAQFHPRLNTKLASTIIRKGIHPEVDSYSTFIENDRKTYTGLSGYLNTLGKTRVFLCGLALDYCVYYSAMDGMDLGFEVVVVIDLSKAIDSPPGHLSEALERMTKRGVRFAKSADLCV